MRKIIQGVVQHSQKVMIFNCPHCLCVFESDEYRRGINKVPGLGSALALVIMTFEENCPSCGGRFQALEEREETGKYLPGRN